MCIVENFMTMEEVIHSCITQVKKFIEALLKLLDLTSIIYPESFLTLNVCQDFLSKFSFQVIDFAIKDQGTLANIHLIGIF